MNATPYAYFSYYEKFANLLTMYEQFEMLTNTFFYRLIICIDTASLTI